MPRFQKSTTSRACGTLSSSRHLLQIRGHFHRSQKAGLQDGHSVRVAIVFGLADLFFDYGQAHSAAELYQFYTQLRVFAYRRANTRPKSRMAHWQRS